MITERIEDAAQVLGWLERNPTEFDTILTLARMEKPSGVAFEGIGQDEGTVAARARAVNRYFGSGTFGACSVCYQPVVTFSDGRSINWPDMGEHSHELLRAESVGPAAPRRARRIDD